MPEPETDSSELEHGEEVGGVLFVAGGDAAAMLDPVEEPLDTISFTIERAAEAGCQRRVALERMFGVAPAASMLRRSQLAA